MKRIVVIALSVVLTLAVAAPAVSAQSAGGDSQPPGQENKIGKLSAAWWQQVVNESSPPTCGPLKQDGVPGNVFFLTGTFTGDPVNETCTVKTGTQTLFPIINYACSPGLSDRPNTEQELRTLCNDLLAYSLRGATDVHATVDGEDVSDRIVCADSPLFDLKVPQNSFLAGPPFSYGVPGTWPAVASGCWVLLHPLPPGEHTITFGGTFPLHPYLTGGVEGVTFTQDITYTVKVVPGNSGGKAKKHKLHKHR
jgi:hypothetical protein